MTTSIENYILVDDETSTWNELLTLAQNPETDAQVLEWISTSKFQDVALAVIANENASVETIVALANLNDDFKADDYDIYEVSDFAREAIEDRYSDDAYVNEIGEALTVEEVIEQAVYATDSDILGSLTFAPFASVAYAAIGNKNVNFATLYSLAQSTQHNGFFPGYNYEGVADDAKEAIEERYPDFDFETSDPSDWM
jgi:hypothetical protein